MRSDDGLSHPISVTRSKGDQTMSKTEIILLIVERLLEIVQYLLAPR
jgi:hypothetical protein